MSQKFIIVFGMSILPTYRVSASPFSTCLHKWNVHNNHCNTVGSNLGKIVPIYENNAILFTMKWVNMRNKLQYQTHSVVYKIFQRQKSVSMTQS